MGSSDGDDAGDESTSKDGEDGGDGEGEGGSILLLREGGGDFGKKFSRVTLYTRGHMIRVWHCHTNHTSIYRATGLVTISSEG